MKSIVAGVCLQFANNYQHDSQEFTICLLDTLNEEHRRVLKVHPNDQSDECQLESQSNQLECQLDCQTDPSQLPVQTFFGITHSTTVLPDGSCHHCQQTMPSHPVVSRENFLLIPMGPTGTQKNVQDLLCAYFENDEDTLEGILCPHVTGKRHGAKGVTTVSLS